MGSQNNKKHKERSLVAELLYKMIMSGVCDNNLKIIKKTAKEYTKPTMTWQEACEILKIGHSKFFELVADGKIKKIDSNAYCTKSITEYLERLI